MTKEIDIKRMSNNNEIIVIVIIIIIIIMIIKIIIIIIIIIIRKLTTKSGLFTIKFCLKKKTIQYKYYLQFILIIYNSF